jgi:hypothetical protein
MYDAMMFLVLLPLVVMTVRFWVGVLKWLMRHQRALGRRIQRARAAFSEVE